MPKDPVFLKIDWQNVLAEGLSWDEWLAQEAKEEYAQEIQEESAKFDASAAVKSQLAAINKAMDKEAGAETSGDTPSKTIHLFAFAGAWCGDCAWNIPVVKAVVDLAPYAKLRFAHPLKHQKLFERYLTNGGESFPKIVFIGDNYVEYANWGPMAAPMKSYLAWGKANGVVKDVRKDLEKFYESKKFQLLLAQEIADLLAFPFADGKACFADEARTGAAA